MNPRSVERAVWTLGIGGFLAYLLGALLAPNPTRILPYVAGASVVGVPIANWYVTRELDRFPSEGAGRLTMFFLTTFVVAYLGMEAVEFVVAPDSTAETVGQAAATLVGLHVGRRTAYRGGYDRIRAALVAERGAE
ncbi:hypothetical protein M0R88_09760 [Halorussus gelatinilyticus]|uniref:Uncharacterized protein n=1 Tax=Halorussus gelatinilyticus TaxID=2937524 RepID=A0A8U0ID41_9EURY|nr:hypothetical protein [Halorussus gelatinilyticus]UPV98817.1 hypothetical protein M0R88_09760 [Halorussus gelatinilyticus]